MLPCEVNQHWNHDTKRTVVDGKTGCGLCGTSGATNTPTTIPAVEGLLTNSLIPSPGATNILNIASSPPVCWDVYSTKGISGAYSSERSIKSRRTLGSSTSGGWPEA